MLQHGAYTLLIDSCYDREEFPTERLAIEWCWASSDEEINAVKFVLNRFFDELEGIYTQNHIKEDLDKYKKNSEINKRIAIEIERNKREANTKREQSVNGSSPNQEPLTINQEPLTKKQNKRKVKTLLPSNFLVDQTMSEWFVGKNFKVDMISSTDKWKDAMLARGDKYIDWVAAWRNGMKKANEWYLDKNPQLTHTPNSPRAFSQ